MQKTLHVVDKKFSVDELESILKRTCMPGKYKVVWHQGKAVYEMFVKFDGKQVKDNYGK